MKVKPPRALFLRYPFGHPFGEAFHVRQQRTILIETLRGLESIQEPGTILMPGYVWRRHAFD
jgi:D-proline reductase (dithiol) PrdB